MRSLLILGALMGITLASNTIFLTFTKIFNKKYATNEEFSKRQGIFMENYNKIVNHNHKRMLGKRSSTQAVNKDNDLTFEEWKASVGVGRPFPSLPVNNTFLMSTNP